MTERAPEEVTRLLRAWCRGEESAFDKLVPLVYSELLMLAHIYMARERPGYTLQTSALVSEAYLRLIDADQVEWKDRVHFFAISANVMSRVLVESARSRRSGRRGGDAVQVEFKEELVGRAKKGMDLVALDEALQALAEIDPRESKTVELRLCPAGRN